MTYIEELDAKLAQLRTEWLANPAKREIIEMQAELIKWAKEMYLRKEPPATFEEAQRIFST